jgi:hypothetical protein
MPNLKVQKFIYRNLVKRPWVNRALDSFGKGLNRIRIPYATGLTRNKSAFFISPDSAETERAKEKLISYHKLRAYDAVTLGADYFSNPGTCFVFEESWYDITVSSAVKSRLKLISRARKKSTGENLVASRFVELCRDFRQREIPPEISARPGIYLDSLGDITNFINVTGARDGIFIDCYETAPFFFPEYSNIVSDLFQFRLFARIARSLFRKPLIRKLLRAFHWKRRTGLINENDIYPFPETSVFALTEALELGAENIKVFKSYNFKHGYLLTFDLNGQKYQIEFLNGSMPNSTLMRMNIGSRVRRVYHQEWARNMPDVWSKSSSQNEFDPSLPADMHGITFNEAFCTIENHFI